MWALTGRFSSSEKLLAFSCGVYTAPSGLLGCSALICENSRVSRERRHECLWIRLFSALSDSIISCPILPKSLIHDVECQKKSEKSEDVSLPMPKSMVLSALMMSNPVLMMMMMKKTQKSPNSSPDTQSKHTTLAKINQAKPHNSRANQQRKTEKSRVKAILCRPESPNSSLLSGTICSTTTSS